LFYWRFHNDVYKFKPIWVGGRYNLTFAHLDSEVTLALMPVAPRWNIQGMLWGFRAKFRQKSFQHKKYLQYCLPYFHIWQFVATVVIENKQRAENVKDSETCCLFLQYRVRVSLSETVSQKALNSGKDWTESFSWFKLTVKQLFRRFLFLG